TLMALGLPGTLRDQRNRVWASAGRGARTRTARARAAAAARGWFSRRVQDDVTTAPPARGTSKEQARKIDLLRSLVSCPSVRLSSHGRPTGRRPGRAVGAGLAMKGAEKGPT